MTETADLQRLNSLFLEPINTLTHLVGILASMAGTGVLVIRAWPEMEKMFTLFIFGASMVCMYTASTLLHGLKAPESWRMFLNRLDHMAVFLLIAGTYKPIVYHIYPKEWRWEVLAVIWLVAVLGIVYKLLGRRIHGPLNTGIYPILSWGGAVPAVMAFRIRSDITESGLALLFLGGLIYMVGFVIYFWQRPDLWPGVFGHHELWHLFVLGGSLCHFLFMYYYIVPFQTG